jgi:transposase
MQCPFVVTTLRNRSHGGRGLVHLSAIQHPFAQQPLAENLDLSPSSPPQIDAETPTDLNLHLIVDNDATHKHPKVQSWLRRHRRPHVHFTPTGSSWLNLVERWFREIADNRIRRGTFRNVEQLIQAIMDYIHNRNQSPKPFVWTAKAEEILAKVQRARNVLEKLPSA